MANPNPSYRPYSQWRYHWRRQKCVVASHPFPFFFPFAPLFFLSPSYITPSFPFSPPLLLEVKPLKIHSSPSGLWGPQPKPNLVHCSFKIWDLMAPILIIFLSPEYFLNKTFGLEESGPHEPPCLRHWDRRNGEAEFLIYWLPHYRGQWSGACARMSDRKRRTCRIRYINVPADSFVT